LRQRGNLRLFQPHQQEIGPKARHRGDKDHHLGHNHESHRQKQKPPRQRIEETAPVQHPIQIRALRHNTVAR
jgi:hypothetical protein